MCLTTSHVYGAHVETQWRVVKSNIVTMLAPFVCCSHYCTVKKFETSYRTAKCGQFMTLTIEGWTLNKTLSGLNKYTDEQTHDRLIAWMERPSSSPDCVFQMYAIYGFYM